MIARGAPSSAGWWTTDTFQERPVDSACIVLYRSGYECSREGMGGTGISSLSSSASSAMPNVVEVMRRTSRAGSTSRGLRGDEGASLASLGERVDVVAVRRTAELGASDRPSTASTLLWSVPSDAVAMRRRRLSDGIGGMALTDRSDGMRDDGRES